MNYKPEISAFASWAIVMIFEILGARILGSYTGSSLFVWTSLIALILGALAFGYYIWWELADEKQTNTQRYELISLLFFIAAGNFLLLPYISDFSLQIITQVFIDIRISSLVGTFFLFVPTSFVLGMIPPLCTKIQLSDIESSGRVVGRIGSIGTIWSIVWTIAAWFFLIPFFWITSLLLILAFICIWLSLLNAPKKWLIYNSIIFTLTLGTLFFFNIHTTSLEKDGIVKIESPYSHVTITDGTSWWRSIRNLYIDNVNHSGMYLDGNDLSSPYTRAYHLFDSFAPDAKNILMLWGAAYSFPKNFLETYPDKNIDVVEIDPVMTSIAKKYFYLTDDPRLTSIHQDARVYLNNSEKKYDAILWDAFWSYFSIPFQLTTLETVEHKYDMLTENGVVILNIIAAQSWNASKFLIKFEYDLERTICIYNF